MSTILALTWLDPLGDGSFVHQVFEGFGPYLGAFTVLLLCGVGLPLPEEITLLGSGVLSQRGQVEFLPIAVVCAIAILIGDSLPYWLGRKYGMAALRVRWVAKVVHAERLSWMQSRFRRHGNWATFACRFFAGVRIPGYFVAGTMGMPYPRFVLLDTLGVLISVPISIYLGRVFAGEMDWLHQRMENFHLVLAFLLLSILLILFLRSRRHRTAAAVAVAALEEHSVQSRSGADELPRPERAGYDRKRSGAEPLHGPESPRETTS